MTQRVFAQIDKEFQPSPHYKGSTPHPNRSNAVDIDDFFEAIGGTWRIHNAGSKRKFIHGFKYANNSNYEEHSYFEYFDENLAHRIRYDYYSGYKSTCTLLKGKTKEKICVGDDEFWDQYSAQLEKRNISFDTIEAKRTA